MVFLFLPLCLSHSRLSVVLMNRPLSAHSACWNCTYHSIQIHSLSVVINNSCSSITRHRSAECSYHYYPCSTQQKSCEVDNKLMDFWCNYHRKGSPYNFSTPSTTSPADAFYIQLSFPNFLSICMGIMQRICTVLSVKNEPFLIGYVTAFYRTSPPIHLTSTHPCKPQPSPSLTESWNPVPYSSSVYIPYPASPLPQSPWYHSGRSPATFR